MTVKSKKNNSEIGPVELIHSARQNNIYKVSYTWVSLV